MSGGYPTSDEFNTAVQVPASFADPDLKAAKVKVNHFGYPIALGGGFALTYEMTAGRKRMAVRCFHKQATGLEAKYSFISRHLSSISGGPFVKFEFQPQGIRVNGRQLPLVKMDWASGEPLGSFLEHAHANITGLRNLLSGFRELSRFLADRQMAHGDLQNGNVLIGPSGLVLIDYDGMYVPGMEVGRGSELGQLHFQHPQRSSGDFGPAMDRFSLIVIDVSLRALIERPALFAKHSSGENILLSAADYRAPQHSDAFADLRTIPAIAADVDRLAALCTGPLSAVPSLENFLAGQGVGGAPHFWLPSPGASQSLAYIGAYPIVDGADFAEVVKTIGDKVELIGRIEEVRSADTRHGRPYVFLNFGHWKGSIAKVNIWPASLKKFAIPPDASWKGKWISVTGLVDPLYEKPNYRHVSITVGDSSHIRVITEAEAKRRLASRLAPTVRAPPESTAARKTVQPGPPNSEVLRGILRAPPPLPAPPPAPAAIGMSRNREIVEKLKLSQGSIAAPAPPNLPLRGPPPQSRPVPPPPTSAPANPTPPPQDGPTPSPSPSSSTTPSREGSGLMYELGRLFRGLFGG